MAELRINLSEAPGMEPQLDGGPLTLRGQPADESHDDSEGEREGLRPSGDDGAIGAERVDLARRHEHRPGTVGHDQRADNDPEGGDPRDQEQQDAP